MRTLLLCSVVVLSACPAPSTTDGGLGGGGGSILGGGTGGTGGGGGGGAVTSLTLDEYCAQLPTKACEYAVRCNYFADVASCRAALDLEGGCTAIRASVKDGRATFNGTKAAQCFADVSTGCAPTKSCEELTTGTGAANADCFASIDCNASTYCNPATPGCPHQCEVRAAAGTFTQNYDGCQAGLLAKYGVYDGGVFGYLCVTPRTLGQTCSGNDCADPLICNRSTGVCETPRGANAICAASDGGVIDGPICVSTLACQPEVGSARRICAAPRNEGEPCGTCRYDLRCADATDGGHVCLPYGAAGATCGADFDCKTELYCHPQTDVCTVALAPGAECDTQRSCGPSHQCATADGGFLGTRHCVDAGPQFASCSDPTP